MDEVSCPEELISEIHECLKKGIKLLISPVQDRISRSLRLLAGNAAALSKGDELHLRILLQSLNEPGIIAEMLHGVQQEEDGTELPEQVFSLLSVIVRRAFQFQV